MANYKIYNSLTPPITMTGKVHLNVLENEIRHSPVKVSLDYLNSNTSNLEAYFKADLDTDDINALDLVVSQHLGVDNVIRDTKVNSIGASFVTLTPNEGVQVTYISHNWCDKTTWYGASERVEDEVLIDSGDHLTYNMTTPKPVIDVTHFKISNESTKTEIKACRAIVKVDNVVKVEDYYKGVGIIAADYTINYETGAVTFHTALSPSAEVEISYNKLGVYYEPNEFARASKWVIKPPAGKVLIFSEAETQFDDDVSMKDSIRFVGFTTVGKDPNVSFLLTAPYNIPSGTKIPITMLLPDEEKRYNTKDDLIDDFNGCYEIPKFGGMSPTFRDNVIDKKVYKLAYKGTDNMRVSDAYGQEIWVFLKDDVEFAGTKATSTIYGVAYNES